MTDCLTCKNGDICTKCKAPKFLDTQGLGCVADCYKEDTKKPSVWFEKNAKGNKCHECKEAGGLMTHCYECNARNFCTWCKPHLFLDTKNIGCIADCQKDNSGGPAWGDLSNSKNKKCVPCDAKWKNMTDCILCNNSYTCLKCETKFLDTKYRGCVDKCETDDSNAPTVWSWKDSPIGKQCVECASKKYPFMDDCYKCTSATSCYQCKSKFLDTTGKGCVDNCPKEDVATPAAWGDFSNKTHKICRRCDEKKGNMTHCLKCNSAYFCTQCKNK